MSKTSDSSAERPSTGTDDVGGQDSEPSHLEKWPCDCCGDRDHSIFDCPEAEKRREERREPEAALRLDPAVRYPRE